MLHFVLWVPRRPKHNYNMEPPVLKPGNNRFLTKCPSHCTTYWTKFSGYHLVTKIKLWRQKFHPYQSAFSLGCHLWTTIPT
uniref:Uncharacterized protein n=1 Tax=Rhizophora mucronata TaxID=61149 RepID=A0A2P2QJ20_RHIMU